MDRDLGRAAALVEEAEAGGARFVHLQFSDILGVVKSLTIPLGLFPEAVEHGKWFDGSAIEGFTRTAESDMYLQPDLDTFTVVPWTTGSETNARVICSVYRPSGELFPGDPRVVLQHVIDEARAMGLVYHTGPELEFFLFNREGGGFAPLPHDRGGYFDYSTDSAAGVRKEMVKALQAMGIEVETDHHEVAAGQHEIDFKYAEALQTADHVITLKYTLKAIAQRYGLYATFMPKPMAGINGSGMHTHQSLATLDGANAFIDANDEYGLSDLARHFIAGQLTHAAGMSAVLAPLVNSYKRFVAGYEAPITISWARFNRGALIRVPSVPPGRSSATRIELRCPDPSCNPYLAFAVMLKAGLDGIRRRLPLPEPVEENLYRLDEQERSRRGIAVLPSTLGEALEALQRDDLVLEALGDHVAERFVEAKQQEWEEYRTQVSAWEVDRYLEVY